MTVDYERYGAELEAETGRVADAVLGADPGLTVTTCPEWTLGELITHLGRGHRWAEAIVSQRAQERVSIDGLPDAEAPGDPGGRSAWLRERAVRLIEAVARVGPETPVWTLGVGGGTARFWLRRRLHEAVVHRADVLLTLGLPFEVAPSVAADGVSEWLDLLSAPRAVERRPQTWGRLAGAGETLHFHATDEPLGEVGEWFVRRTPDGVAWEHGHAKGDVAVRAPAAALLLALMRRVPVDDPALDVIGDRDLFEHWVAHTPF